MTALAPTTSPRTLDTMVEAAALDRMRIAVVEVTIRAGEMSPLHVRDEDEVVRILEGRAVVYAGAETVELGPGDAYVAPRDVPQPGMLPASDASAA